MKTENQLWCWAFEIEFLWKKWQKSSVAAHIKDAFLVILSIQIEFLLKKNGKNLVCIAREVRIAVHIFNLSKRTFFDSNHFYVTMLSNQLQ